MLFNGIDLTPYIRIKEVRGRGIAQKEVTLLEVPGADNAFIQQVRRPPRSLEVDLNIIANGYEEMRKKIEDLNEILDVETAVPIIFPDETDRTYYGIPQATAQDEENPFIHKGTLTIICPDGYKYSDEIVTSFNGDVASLTNRGKAETVPTIEMTVEEPITFAMVQNHLNEYLLIGTPTEVDSEIVDTKTLLIDETGTTISEWTTATSEMEGGSQGSIGTDGAGITAPSYGTGTGYHGPSVYKEVPLTGDFEIEMRGQLLTDAIEQTGRFGFYLFDNEMREIAFMATVDNSIYVQRKLAEGRIGPFVGDFKNYLISSRNYQKEWDNFPAFMRLRRVGDTYTFYVARVLGDGRHMEPLTASWTVSLDQYRGQLKYVGIFIDKYGTTNSPHTNRIDYIRVYALSEAVDDQTPYIAYPGDIITFTGTEVLINGENRDDLLNFGADFFSLKKGTNQLYQLPPTSFTTLIKYKERYL